MFCFIVMRIFQILNCADETFFMMMITLVRKNHVVAIWIQGT
jgi:hypothetical protein